MIEKTIRVFPDSLFPENIGNNERGLAMRFISDAFLKFFNIHWEHKAWTETYWNGHKIYKYPGDIISYQEIIFECRPTVVIETGTYYGGGALFLANMMDLTTNGKVISIDLEFKEKLPVHPSIKYVRGDSVSPLVLEEVKSHIQPGDKVMVILDSRHNKDHVLNEINNYHPLVSIGQYMIVEDTYLGLWMNVKDPQTNQNIFPGPREAVNEFIKNNKEFVVDRYREKFILTQNPYGYLKRVL